MKMRLFYLVRKYAKKDEFRDMDCQFISGPFSTHTEAWDAKQDYLRNNYWQYGDHEIVEQIMEVQ